MSVAVWAKFVDVVGRIIFPPTSQEKKKRYMPLFVSGTCGYVRLQGKGKLRL